MAEIELKVKHLKFAKSYSISDEKSTIIYGSNGMGKTSIYNAIKSKHPEYAYIDYGDMKNDFIKGTKTTVNINPYAQKYEKLKQQQDKIHEVFNIKNNLKNYGISSEKRAKEVSLDIQEIRKNNYLSTNINISKEVYEKLSKIEQIRDIIFLLENINDLKKISNIDEDIKTMKKEYLLGILKKLDEKLNEECRICPVCNSEVENLMEIIRNKIKESKKIETELLKAFKENDNEFDSDKLANRFNRLLNLSKSVTDKEIIDYIFLPDFNKLQELNKIIEANKEIEEEVNEAKEMMKESYNNLMNMESKYTKYIRMRFGASIKFDGKNKTVNLKLARLPKQHSTGEINLILFTTKIFEFMGGDKPLIILDDPISSYDIINQYKIVFDIVMSNNNPKKNFLIFTHNLRMIDLINTQNNNAFDFKMLDKMEKKIYIHDYKINGKDYKDSIVNITNIISNASENKNIKYIELSMERENKSNDDLHKLFHYDYPHSVGIDNQYYPEYSFTNQELVDMVEKMDIKDFYDKNYCDTAIHKIMLMLGLRVWIEKKLYDVFECDEKYKKKKSLNEKIDYALPLNIDSKVLNQYPKLKRTDLMSRKVMLNQNAHYKSQGNPFDYVLNLSVDDIISEINEVKGLFHVDNSIA